MKRFLFASSFAVLAWVGASDPANAQDMDSEAPAAAGEADGASESWTAFDGGEIVVTARQRNETSLESPVVLTAYSGEQLERMGVTSLTDVGNLTPQLVISPASGAYGGNLTLRGVASPTSNASSEPAVTINIDGVPISYGGVVRMGTMDVGQIEVLKGPQALFFGKNSSGGIVAIKSAEPTDQFSAKASLGYEFNARQIDLDGFVSGPLSDTLNARIAYRLSRQRGYFKNVAPGASFSHAPGTDEDGLRLSTNWQPNDRLTVKLTGTYDHVGDNGASSAQQKIACPAGAARGPTAVPDFDDCKANDTIVFTPFPGEAARAVTGNSEFDSNQNYLKVSQYLLTGNVTYDLSDSVSLNSVTGYYVLDQKGLDTRLSGARFFTGGFADVQKRTFSQELRLAYSSPDFPIDLMIGGFYQHDKFTLNEQVVRNAAAVGSPDNIVQATPNWVFPLRSKSYSAFIQTDWQLTDKISFSSGVRYSRDLKYQDIVPPAPLPNKFGVGRVAFSDWSPEFTLSYQPSEDTNLFASFKKGYKSGAYQIGANVFERLLANPSVSVIDNSYEPETVKGFEVGLKTRMFDRQLRVNLAAYTYLYKDLQVSRIDPATITLQILNASSARVKGLEGDFTFRPNAIEGLSITGAMGYNLARYASDFYAPCYVGQTISGGCDLDGPDADTTPDQQQFRGRPLPRAPKVSASAGFTYEMPIGAGHNATVNANAIYTSSSFVSQELSPIGKAPERVLVDAGLKFSSNSDSYEIAFIGRNLTDKHFPLSGFQAPLIGSGTGTTSGVLPDFVGVISRGREFWLRLTLRPSGF